MRHKKDFSKRPGLINGAKCKFGDGKVSFLEQKLFITLVLDFTDLDLDW